ncbi:MAG: formylglycine-generating enzyme family protein, partial [Bacteroidota bacterium]
AYLTKVLENSFLGKKEYAFKLPKLGLLLEMVLVSPRPFKPGISQEDFEKILGQKGGSAINYKNEIVKDSNFTFNIEHIYWIGKFEITNEQFKAVIPSHSFKSGAGKLPVTGLRKEEILAFCKELTKMAGSHGYEFDIPTEMEWEYAAKIPNTNFPFLNTEARLEQTAANFGDRGGTVKMVGSYPNEKSWTGSFDMVGNASELCRLQNGVYKEPNGRFNFVAKGGSFYSEELDCRVTSRHLLYNPRERTVGFRVVMRQKRED